MAGPGVLNASIAIQQRRMPPPRQQQFCRQQLVEASLTLGGMTFRSFVREGTTVNEFIEQVARENGGHVEKVYYPSLQAYELVSVRIGGICLVKSAGEGLHFYLGSSDIPFASMKDGGIVFPNGEEMRVSRCTANFSVGVTADNFNPQKIADFGAKYDGGARMSDAARQVAGAHGDTRTEKLLLPKNLLVIDKETGDIRTASERAAKIGVEGFASPQFQVPSYHQVGLTMPSENGPVALPMDGSAGRVPYIFIRMFDGKITDHLNVCFSPLRADDASIRMWERAPSRSGPASLYFSAMCANAPVSGAFADLQGVTGGNEQVQPGGHARSGEPANPQHASPVQPALRAWDCDSLPKPCSPGPGEWPKGSAPEALARPVRQASEGNAATFHQMTITPKAISHYWRNPRLLQKEGIQRAPLPSKHPATSPSVALSSPGKGRKKKPRQLAGKIKKSREKEEENKKKAKPRPKTEAPLGRMKRRQDGRFQPMQEMRKKRGKGKIGKGTKPAVLAVRLQASRSRLSQAKPKREKLEKRARQRSSPEALLKKKEAKRLAGFHRPEASHSPKASATQEPKARPANQRQPVPRTIPGQKTAVASNRFIRKASAGRKNTKAKNTDEKKKAAKKKLPAYFMLGMLGLLARRKRKRRFSRGPAAAGS